MRLVSDIVTAIGLAVLCVCVVYVIAAIVILVRWK